MYYVYVLVEQRTGDTYIGYSSDLKQRLEMHRKSKGALLTHNGEWQLVYYEAYFNKQDAMARERKLKYHGNARKHLFNRIKNSIDCVKISAGCSGHRLGVTKVSPAESAGKRDHRR